LTELTSRASQAGYARTSLGLRFLPFAHFFVFTGEKYAKEAIVYGEYSSLDATKFDPLARKPYDPIKELTDSDHIINLNNDRVPFERKAFKNSLSPERAMDACKVIFEETIANWSNEKSLNHTIAYACTRIISLASMNVKDVPEELIPLL